MNSKSTAYFTVPARNRGFDEAIRFINALRMARGGRVLKKIQIAGTNGKGSTAAMLYSILHAAGYNVGLNTSPSLVRVNERVSVNGVQISDKRLASYVLEIEAAEEKTGRLFGGFERITAAAYLYFLDENVDFAVMETGLGGRFDTVSAVNQLILSSITGIGMDHMVMLGDTLPEIAMEKCGIMRSGVPVITHPQAKEAYDVITRTSGALKNPLYETSECDIEPVSCENGRQSMVISCRGNRYNVDIPLLGDYQRDNAANALLCALTLRDMGEIDISTEDIERGFKDTVWEGRMERVLLPGMNTPLILDGAHNPHAMSALVKSLSGMYPAHKFNAIISIMHDKDIAHILEYMSEVVENVVCVRVNSRAIDANELSDMACRAGINATFADSVDDGLRMLDEMSNGDTALCVGSLYLVGAVLAKK